MSWFAILLALASLGGAPSKPVSKQCKAAKTVHAAQKHCKVKKAPKAKVKPRATPTPTPKHSTPGATRPDGATPTATPDPGATPTPGVTPTPTPTATAVPTATPVYPKRTGVDLYEWVVRSSYRTLAAGTIDFNVSNLGEDDHNLSVRGGGKEYGRLDLAPRDADTLRLTLAPGTYTLYCSLIGHEELGMRADITVR